VREFKGTAKTNHEIRVAYLWANRRLDSGARAGLRMIAHRPEQVVITAAGKVTTGRDWASELLPLVMAVNNRCTILPKKDN